MLQRPRGRLLAPCGVLLAFLGVWLGHTVEYVRVWGVAGLGDQLQGPIHGYMVPLAGVLLGLSVLFGLRLRGLWLGLGRRLDQARSDLLGTWRGRRLEPTPALAPGPPSAASRLLALWLPLAALQVSLYLIQENVEAALAGAPTPGWGAISGGHWAAAPIQVGVALVLAAGAALVGRLFAQRAELIERVHGLVRALFAYRRRPLAEARPGEPDALTPLDAVGGHLWRRPPPAVLFG